MSRAPTIAAGSIPIRAELASTECGNPRHELYREHIPKEVDIDAGLDLLDDPTTFEPGVVWYYAWGRRSA